LNELHVKLQLGVPLLQFFLSAILRQQMRLILLPIRWMAPV